MLEIEDGGLSHYKKGVEGDILQHGPGPVRLHLPARALQIHRQGQQDSNSPQAPLSVLLDNKYSFRRRMFCKIFFLFQYFIMF